MNYLKSYKIFEYQDEEEIPWEKFEKFIFDVQDTFTEIMDDNLLISEYGQYSFEYQDDSIFMKIKKPKSSKKFFELYQDVKIALARLKDTYDIKCDIQDTHKEMRLVITLLS